LARKHHVLKFQNQIHAPRRPLCCVIWYHGRTKNEGKFVALTIPSRDGEINQYNLSLASVYNPRIYYVNGIRTNGQDHAKTAALLSLLTERPIWGVYNRTGGFAADLGQSALDYLQNAGARATSGGLTPAKPVARHEIPKLVDDIIKRSLIWNKATVELFRTLMLNLHTRQMIVAHSQGNMVTSNALFVVEKALGSQALQNIRVYSLASPSPGWPLGLRYTNGGGGRQENAFMNDMVALLRPHNLAAKVGIDRFQNAGDFRTHKDAGAVSLKPHDTTENMALNFLQSIRNDLGIGGKMGPNFLANKAKQIEALIP
jgi:hypothetical protein